MEVEEACKSEERGLTRCRGGSQGTWEMHSSRCQSPHQGLRLGAPPGPHHEVRRTLKSHCRDSGRRPSRSCGIASLDNPVRTGPIASLAKSPGMIEWWKNSSAKRIGDGDDDDDAERKKRTFEEEENEGAIGNKGDADEGLGMRRLKRRAVAGHRSSMRKRIAKDGEAPR
ncbi:hypothetical protein PUN28_005354 [Cardiocondyla obscurior]|uniref:Uncharacterized protein n=1 Tax=Cardiocondyla obscurior TaxID=286306 RepID=A0AAW2GK40_9HYME